MSDLLRVIDIDWVLRIIAGRREIAGIPLLFEGV